LLISSQADNCSLIDSVCQAKLKEIQTGADGFLVYHFGLVQPLCQLWSTQELVQVCTETAITGSSLLKIPTGGATLAGLEHNIAVGILFIHSWISLGQGSFEFKGFIEDSATAEISRSQASSSDQFQLKSVTKILRMNN
jgi:malate synthase